MCTCAMLRFRSVSYAIGFHVRAGVRKITSYVTLIHELICPYMRTLVYFHNAVAMLLYTLSPRAL